MGLATLEPMAERLAPEAAPLVITSRPERPRGRSRRVLRRTVGAVLALGVVAAGSVVTLQVLGVDRQAQTVRAAGLIPTGMPASALVVLARPGQEVPMAGTLAALDAAGVRVSVLSLTQGEAQAPDLRSASADLGAIRADELAHAGDLLGVDSTTTAAFDDGGIMAAEPGEVTGAISRAIEAAEASVVLTVADLSGADADSQAAASYALAAAQHSDSGVARVWTVTRGEREVSWGDRIADMGMDVAQLPEAEVAVRIDAQTAVKGQALRAHGTQSPNLARTSYPYADRLPAWAYFRFWDREYFALAWGQELE